MTTKLRRGQNSTSDINRLVATFDTNIRTDIIALLAGKLSVVNLTADRYIYVSPTGNDLLGDGSAANPYASIARAERDCRAVITNGFNVYIVLKAGTHVPQNGYAWMARPLDNYHFLNHNGLFVITGEDRDTTILAVPAGNSAFVAYGSTNLALRNLTLSTSSSSALYGIVADEGARLWVSNVKVVCSGTGKFQNVFRANAASYLTFFNLGTDLALSNAAGATPILADNVSCSNFIYAIRHSSIAATSAMTFTGANTVSSAFMHASVKATIEAVGFSVTGAETVTGKKHNVATGGIIDTFGQLAQIPGTINGTADAYGSYAK